MKDNLPSRIDFCPFFWEPKNPRFSTRIHVSKPTPLELRNLGQLFLIVEIQNENKVNKQIMQTLIEDIELQYYNTNEIEPSKGFEKMLHKTNKKIAEISSEVGSRWIDDLNIAIGISYQKKLFFSEKGGIQTYLIHEGKIVDLLEHNGLSQTNPLKIFSNISSGHLEENDSLIFCSSSLLDYLSLEKLKRIINSHETPDEARKELEHLLVTDAGETTFAAIIIKKIKTKKTNSVDAEGGNFIEKSAFIREDSMRELVGKEQRTNELLSPSVMPNIKDWIRNLRNRISKKRTNEEKSIADIIPAQAMNNSRKSVHRALHFLRLCAARFGIILSKLWEAIRSLKKNHKIIANIKNLPYKTNKGISKGIINFQNLNRYRKILFIGAIILIVAFSWSISKFGERKEEKKAINQYQQNIQKAGEKQLAAESNLIFNNEKEARRILQEAREYIKNIPNAIPSIQPKLDAVKAKIEETSKKINRVTAIQDPKMIADLSKIDAQSQTTDFSILDNVLITATAHPENLYTTTLSSFASDKISIQNFPKSPIRNMSIIDANSILLLHEDKTLSKLFPIKPSIESLEITSATNNTDKNAIFLYNQKLYILDQTGNQIFKYSPEKQKYAKGSTWIKDSEIDLKNAVSFAVDGSVWVLKANGGVEKYFDGKRVKDWNVQSIEPNLNSATRLHAEANSKNIYIIDPSNKRIIVFSKDKGALVKQYTSEKFNSMKNIIVHEQSKKIYILNGLNIYMIDIE